MDQQILLSQMTPESLRDLIRNTMTEVMEKQNPPTPDTKYLTRLEVCRLFHITLPTLGEYVKKGILKGHKIGRRVLFDEMDIKQALQEIPTLKYKRLIKRP
ncbi:MAG: helix-turn-helix domain-containing protein [Bacteroidales bacterium]|nr:helix-turn-helix domain-containing protein [Bacteroidales bacterium]